MNLQQQTISKHNLFQPWMRTALVALICVAPMLVMAQDRRSVDRIVALVEDDVVLQSELDQAIDMIERQAAARGDRLPARSVIEEQVLERLILTRLEVMRAESTGIRASDADIDQALEQVARQNRMSLSQLRAAIESDGIDFREFRRDVREELLTSRLRQRVVSSMEDITETEVDILLASDRFGGADYLLSQIVIQVPESATHDEVSQAQLRAEEARRQLDQGVDFSTVALTYSQASDALEGGDVGWRNINTLPPMFADAVEATEPGQFTDLIRTPGGFVILHVRDQRDQSEVIVREFRARHLMIEPSELLSPADAERRIRELRQRLEAGEDFAEIARNHSTDESSANIGGLLNWFPAGQYGEDVQSALDALNPGEISQPFRTMVGWHVVKLEDVREADRTTEALRGEARDMLYRQKGEEEIERYLRQLRDEAFVEIRL
jgi:peptidyl-prolyl cis-trans isomerase SurA